jgi:hypothetical protein
MKKVVNGERDGEEDLEEDVITRKLKKRKLTLQ